MSQVKLAIILLKLHAASLLYIRFLVELAAGDEKQGVDHTTQLVAAAVELFKKSTCPSTSIPIMLLEETKLRRLKN